MQRLQRTLGLSSRPRNRAVSALVISFALASSLAACGGEEESPVAENEISVEEYPDYYPAEYADLVEEAKGEGGELVIYSNTSEENWAPIFRDFKKKFPWVEDVSANDLDSDEVFQRVLSEQSTGSSPADLVVSNAAVAWADFAEREGTLMEYESPELGEVPDFGQPPRRSGCRLRPRCTAAHGLGLGLAAPHRLAGRGADAQRRRPTQPLCAAGRSTTRPSSRSSCATRASFTTDF